jgi:glycosyltransferase involved in cell wall biosynthesis
MNGLRIGVITHNYPLRASESKDAGKFIYNFAQKLSEKVEVVEVFCPNYTGKKEKYKKVPVTWFKWGGGSEKFGNWGIFSLRSIYLFFNLWLVGNKEIEKFVKKNRINYLLCFWNFPAGLWGMHIKKKLGIPYVTWALGSDIYVFPKLPIIKQLTQIILKGADKCYGNSYDICKAIKKLAGIKAEFLPTSNPIDIVKSKRPNFQKNIFNFLFLGRSEKVKGPDILIEAVSKLAEKRKDFLVTMIGGGSLIDRLKQSVQELNISENVHILGYVEDQTVVNGYLINSDALVIPSRSESFPLVITEALQTGLPIIGSNVGDMPHVVKKYGLGYIFQSGDPQKLARVMEQMMRYGKGMRKKKRKLMGELYKGFQLDTVVNRLVSYAQSLV